MCFLSCIFSTVTAVTAAAAAAAIAAAAPAPLGICIHSKHALPIHTRLAYISQMQHSPSNTDVN